MTELVTRAEGAGLVARTADPQDRRSKRITPTEEGSRRFLATLTELAPERQRLLAILEEVASHTSRLSR
jgi:DNA-binding MarR family transcriptional regulator